MPLFDTPPDAVDKIYAASLFELVEAKGGREMLESISGELDELVELVRQEPKLGELFASRIIPVRDKETSLRHIFEGRISQVLLNLFLVLNEKDRPGRLLSITAAYQAMVQERFGRVEIDVFTRHAIPQDQVDAIRRRLEATLGREPVLYTYTDPGMIGGIRMQLGDRLLDASVATRLQKMRQSMKVDGAARMRARFEEAFSDEEGQG